MPVADRVGLPAQVRLVRLEGAKQVYYVGGVLVRCDHVTVLTTAHACCMLDCTRRQLDSDEEHPLLFCSPWQSTVRPYKPSDVHDQGVSWNSSGGKGLRVLAGQLQVLHTYASAMDMTAMVAEVVRTGMLPTQAVVASCLACHVLMLTAGVWTVLSLTDSQETQHVKLSFSSVSFAEAISLKM